MLAMIGVRFVPIPVETEEEFQVLSHRLATRLEKMACEAEQSEGKKS